MSRIRCRAAGRRIYKKDSLDACGPGNNGTAYVFPTDQLDNVIREAAGDPHRLAAALGLPDGFFEGGTDLDAWIPGGYLPSGIPEAVIDIPETATGVKNGEYIPTLWPGSPRNLTL
ncbi:hypothetical protein [Microbacterium sp.]|uniref:hypothetical protein n=1 Tax=Microbacterium sp. TaxID=51671 RepID=UPI0039E3DFD7